MYGYTCKGMNFDLEILVSLLTGATNLLDWDVHPPKGVRFYLFIFVPFLQR